MKKIWLVLPVMLFMECTGKDRFEKATVAFHPITAAELQENGTALIANMIFSAPIEVASEIRLSVSSTKRITTNPAADPFDGSIKIPVAVGSKSAALTILPINDKEALGDEVITIRITGYSGSIKSKASDLFVVNFKDDEVPPSVAGLRAQIPANLPVGGRINIEDSEFIVRGVITSDRSTANLNARAAYFQDATAAIGLFFDVNTPYDLGDSIEIRGGDGAYLSKFFGFAQYYIKQSQTKLLGKGVSVKPRIITADELNTNKYEAQLVQLNNCTIIGGGTAKYYSGSGSGTNITVNGGGGTFVMRTSSTATFGNEIIKSGTVTITGLAGRFNDTGQLILRNPAIDIK